MRCVIIWMYTDNLLLVIYDDLLKNNEIYRLNFLRFLKTHMRLDELASSYREGMQMVTHSSDMYYKKSLVLEVNLRGNMDRHYDFFRMNDHDYYNINRWKDMCNFVIKFLHNFDKS